jgi:hypothetical protein
MTVFVFACNRLDRPLCIKQADTILDPYQAGRFNFITTLYGQFCLLWYLNFSCFSFHDESNQIKI